MVLDILLGPSIQQQLHTVQLAFVGGPHQRSFTFLHRQSEINKHGNSTKRSIAAMIDRSEPTHTHRILGILLDAGLQQQPHAVRVTTASGMHQRRPPVLRLRMRVTKVLRPRPQSHAHPQFKCAHSIGDDCAHLEETRATQCVHARQRGDTCAVQHIMRPSHRLMHMKKRRQSQCRQGDQKFYSKQKPPPDSIYS